MSLKSDQLKKEREARKVIVAQEKEDYNYKAFLTKKISKVFGIYLDVEVLNRTGGSLKFTSKNDYVDEEKITFDMLATISDWFGTRLINLRAEHGNDGYCETCDSPWTAQAIYIDGITNWPQG